MKKNLSSLGTKICKTKQQQIVGGNACIECYDFCVATSRNRVELGICFDQCQASPIHCG